MDRWERGFTCKQLDEIFSEVTRADKEKEKREARGSKRGKDEGEERGE